MPQSALDIIRNSKNKKQPSALDIIRNKRKGLTTSEDTTITDVQESEIDDGFVGPEETAESKPRRYDPAYAASYNPENIAKQQMQEELNRTQADVAKREDDRYKAPARHMREQESWGSNFIPDEEEKQGPLGAFGTGVARGALGTVTSTTSGALQAAGDLPWMTEDSKVPGIAASELNKYVQRGLSVERNKDDDWGAYWADVAGAGIGSMAAFLAGGIATRAASTAAKGASMAASLGGAAAEALVAGATAYDQAKEAGATPLEAAKAAAEVSATTAATTFVTGKYGAFSEGVKNPVAKAVTSAALEGTQEAIQGVGEQAATRYYDPNFSTDKLSEGWVENFVGGFVGGGAVGGAIGTAESVARWGQDQTGAPEPIVTVDETPRPVTKEEARQVFDGLMKASQKLTGAKKQQVLDEANRWKEFNERPVQQQLPLDHTEPVPIVAGRNEGLELPEIEVPQDIQLANYLASSSNLQLEQDLQTADDVTRAAIEEELATRNAPNYGEVDPYQDPLIPQEELMGPPEPPDVAIPEAPIEKEYPTGQIPYSNEEYLQTLQNRLPQQEETVLPELETEQLEFDIPKTRYELAGSELSWFRNTHKQQRSETFQKLVDKAHEAVKSSNERPFYQESIIVDPTGREYYLPGDITEHVNLLKHFGYDDVMDAVADGWITYSKDSTGGINIRYDPNIPEVRTKTRNLVGTTGDISNINGYPPTTSMWNTLDTVMEKEVSDSLKWLYSQGKGKTGLWPNFDEDALYRTSGLPQETTGKDLQRVGINFVHGTTPERAEAIKKSGKISGDIPVSDNRTFSYSEFGSGTVYAAPEDSWWFEDFDKSMSTKIPVRLSDDATVFTVTSVTDLDVLARKIGYDSYVQLRKDLGIDLTDPESIQISETARKKLAKLYDALLIDLTRTDNMYVSNMTAQDQLAVLNPEKLEIIEQPQQSVFDTFAEDFRQAQLEDQKAQNPPVASRRLGWKPLTPTGYTSRGPVYGEIYDEGIRTTEGAQQPIPTPRPNAPLLLESGRDLFEGWQDPPTFEAGEQENLFDLDLPTTGPTREVTQQSLMSPAALEIPQEYPPVRGTTINILGRDVDLGNVDQSFADAFKVIIANGTITDADGDQEQLAIDSAFKYPLASLHSLIKSQDDAGKQVTKHLEAVRIRATRMLGELTDLYVAARLNKLSTKHQIKVGQLLNGANEAEVLADVTSEKERTKILEAKESLRKAYDRVGNLFKGLGVEVRKDGGKIRQKPRLIERSEFSEESDKSMIGLFDTIDDYFPRLIYAGDAYGKVDRIIKSQGKKGLSQISDDILYNMQSQYGIPEETGRKALAQWIEWRTRQVKVKKGQTVEQAVVEQFPDMIEVLGSMQDKRMNTLELATLLNKHYRTSTGVNAPMFGSVEAQRTLNISPFADPNPLRVSDRYFNRAAQRFAEIKQLGQYNEKLEDLFARTYEGSVPPDMLRELANNVKKYLHTDEDAATYSKTMTLAMKLMTNKLKLAWIGNIIQNVQTARVTGWTPLLGSYKDFILDQKQVRADGRQSGATADIVMNPQQDFLAFGEGGPINAGKQAAKDLANGEYHRLMADSITAYAAQNTILHKETEIWNRYIATRAGIRWAAKMAKGLKSGDQKQIEAVKRDLEMLEVPYELLEEYGIGSREFDLVIGEAVNRTINFTSDRLSTPDILHAPGYAGQLFRLMFQFKTYAYGMTKVMMKNHIRAAAALKAGDYAHATKILTTEYAYLGAILPATGFFIGWARNGLYDIAEMLWGEATGNYYDPTRMDEYLEEMEDLWDENKAFAVLKGSLEAATLGIYGAMIEAYEYGGPDGALASAAGPGPTSTFEAAHNLIQTYLKASEAESTDEALEETMHGIAKTLVEGIDGWVKLHWWDPKEENKD